MSIEAPGSLELRLRRLGPGDEQACQSLEQLCRPHGWDLQQWTQELEDAQHFVLGIQRGPDLLAVASSWLILDELHIQVVLVHPVHRRTGLGRWLLTQLIQRGLARGASRATLEVAASNRAALALYGSLGFRTSGRRRGYYRDGQDALIQWCQLTPTS